MVPTKQKQVILMDDKELRVYLETKLRNLKRSYAKLVNHADMVEECIELKAEIDGIERELKLID